MSSKAKERRPRKRPSGQSFVDELREEVENSLSAEECIVTAFREMCSAELSLDVVRNLPSAALSAYLAGKYEEHVVSYIQYFIPELRVLPESLRLEIINMVTGISRKDASVVFEACSVLNENAQPARIAPDFKDLSVRGYPVLLLSPTSNCLNCKGLLTQHNKPCEASVHSLRGKAVGLKFSLRCEKCKLNFNYDRYGNTTKGWKLYEEARPLVEATDVCFVDRRLMEFQLALA
jgi:hypothetical protein